MMGQAVYDLQDICQFFEIPAAGCELLRLFTEFGLQA